MRHGIPICKLFSNPHLFAYGDPRMHTAIPVCKITHMGIKDLISHMEIFPVCIWVVTEISSCACGDRANSHMKIGIMYLVIPVCIWGLQWSAYAYRDQDQSLYAYGDYMSCDMHTGISVIPICIRGLILIPVCIWKLQQVIGSHHGESLCLFLEELKIIMSTTNKQWN